MAIEVTSYLVPNLTLLDLPGYMQATHPGEPREMPEQIRKLVGKYLSEPHTLVLCVVPAYLKASTKLCLLLWLGKNKKQYCGW